MKHRTQTSYMEDYEKTFEDNSGEIITQPDQVMSIKELLARHTQSEIPHLGYQPIYDPDGDMPNPKTLDLTDVDEIRRNNAETSNTIQRERTAALHKAKNTEKSESAQPKTVDKKEQTDTTTREDKRGQKKSTEKGD